MLVVPVKLGAIAQAVANVALARQTKVTLKGIILSCDRSETEEKIEDWAPTDLIQNLTQLPVLGILPYLSSEQLKDLDYLAKVSTNLNWEKLGLELMKFE